MIFGATEQLSATLQYKDINAQEVILAVSAAVGFLERQRSDAAFDTFYGAVVEEAKAYTQEPALPRVRIIPRRINDDGQYFKIINIQVQRHSSGNILRGL